MDIDSLTAHGIQQPLIDTWKYTGIATLTDGQDRILSHQPLWEGRNILVVAPTSSGKTFAGEVLAARSAFSLKRAIFLVPYKAIAEEKYAEFRERYERLGISVVISDADHTRFDRAIRRGEFGIAVIVYEKMAQLLVQSSGILEDCSLVVVDEIQMIADRTRGPSLEILLTHIRQLNDQPQLLGLSATMSDLGGLDSWLDADVINIHERPVPLWEGIAYPTGSSELENIETKERQPGPNLAAISIPQSTWSPASKLDTAYRILMAEGLSKQTLIFRTRVDDTATTARNLAHVMPAEPVAPEVRSQIGELEDTRVSDFLNQWIDKRVAYHNAGLSLEERSLIERLFREGVIRVLVTTSTLAAGVNMPADVVILLDYKRYEFSRGTSVPIPVGEYKNSVGRAGRLGISTKGHSYLVVDNPNETRSVGSHYLLGQAGHVRSAMPSASDLGALALGLLSLRLIENEDDFKDSIRHSFAFKHYFQNEDERGRFLTQFTEALGELEANKLTFRDSGGLAVTDLGAVAASSHMSLKSFYRLLEALIDPEMKADRVSDLLPLLCQVEEFRTIRPYDAEDRAAVLQDWITGKAMAQIIETHSGQYELGSGHVRRIGETAAWMLNAAARIAEIPGLLSESETISKEISELAQRCKFGVPTEIVQIAGLQVLHRSELNLLVDNSTGRVLDTLHKILDTDLNDFAGILSPQRAERLKTAILDQIGESLLSRRFGHASRADRHRGLRQLVEKCYDQQGTGFEAALEDLLNSPLVNLDANRFGRQRTGQPDLEVVGLKGTIVIQATASEDDRKPVNWAKAREVLSSVGFSGQLSNFVTVARPGFHDVAIGNANEIADRRDRRLLLIPLSELIEVCISEIEETIPRGSLLKILEDAQGHFVADEWFDQWEQERIEEALKSPHNLVAPSFSPSPKFPPE